jgi:transglutaminase-like putative cysteine protease
MLIRVGYELTYEFEQATPMILNLNVHYTRSQDLVRPDTMVMNPAVPLSMYRDGFGNWCTRVVAPSGTFCVRAEGVISDSGLAEPACPRAVEHTVQSLPDETLVYLLPSRYCETDHLSEIACQAGTPVFLPASSARCAELRPGKPDQGCLRR